MDLGKLFQNLADMRTTGSILLVTLNEKLNSVGANPLPEWASWVVTGLLVAYVTFFVKSEKK